MFLRPFRPLLSACLMALLAAPTVWAETSIPVVLCRQRHAAMPIVAGSTRSLEAIATYQTADLHAIDPTQADSATRVERAIGALAQFLGRMGGSTFALQHGEGDQAIAVGLFTDFPELNLGDRFNPDDLLRQEEYLLRSHDDGLQIVAATEQALENAVWDLLHRLGYRQYFPGRLWEFVPTLEQIEVSLHTFEKPDFHSRLIWYGGGTQEHTQTDYHNWSQRNRAVAGVRVNTSHEYGRIQSRHREAFAANHDYYAMVDGERKTGWHAKFNVANPALRQLVIDDGIQWFKNNPDELSKSMDPSDHGGWDESEEAKTIGTPTDQALLLANLVAEAATNYFGSDRYVGMYSYFQHQAAPTCVKPHPNVIVSFATRFLRGQTVEALIGDWQKSGTRLTGIREYYGVRYFDQGLPLRSIQGASISYICDSILDFHRYQARFFTAESSDDWGMLGLGHYIATRLLWDLDHARQVDALVEGFLLNMFGSAHEPMRQFYSLLNGEERPRLTDRKSLGELYAYLSEARSLAASDRSEVQQRIDALILYVRCIELYTDLLQSEGEQAQSFYEQAIRLAYRSRHFQLVSINGYIRNTPLRGRGILPDVSIPANARWNVAEDENPWKSNDPFAEGEIQTILSHARKRYSDTPDDVGLSTEKISSTEGSSRSPLIRNLAGDFRISADAGEAVSIEFHTRIMDIGVGPSYMVFAPSGKVIRRDRIDATAAHTLEWRAEETGTYRILLEANYNAIRYVSSNRIRFQARDDLDVLGRVNLLVPRATLYFWVPAGQESLSVEIAGQGDDERVRAWLIDAGGQVVDEKDQISGNEPYAFEIPADARRQGGAWSIRFNRSTIGHFEDVFLTLPPEIPAWLSMSPEGLVQNPDRR